MTLPPSLVVNWCWQSIKYSPTLHSVGDDWPPHPPPLPPWKQRHPPLNPSQPPTPKICWLVLKNSCLFTVGFFPFPPPFFFLTYECLYDVPWVITLPQLFCDPSAYPLWQAFQYEKRTFYHPDRARCGGTRVRGSQDGGGVGRGWKASMQILALEKSIYPRIGAAWWHWLTSLTGSYQNPRAKQCKRDLRSERSK